MGAAALPRIRPMLATLGTLPDPPGWGYEFKWDGVRAIVYVDAGRLHIASRNDRDVTHSYPELRALLDGFPCRRAVLDGEILTLDERGVPSFGLLQQRMHVQEPGTALVARVPVRLHLFDVLRLGARPVLDLPYTRRREELAGLGLGGTGGGTPIAASDGAVVATPPYWADDAGRDLMDAAAELGLEGVVAKRLDSPYQPGARSRSWIKAPLNRTAEVVVGGWKPGAGRRSGAIGSLLLGAYDAAGGLVFVGHVGTGFTDAMLRDLGDRLGRLGRAGSPFARPVPREHARAAHWVSPELVGEVSYRTLTAGGHLRHPSWRGLRADKEPAEARLASIPR